METIKMIINICKYFVDGAAVIIMMWGVVLSLIKLVKVEFAKFNDLEQIVYKENIRAYLATYILLGLELFIVADIILLIVSPDQTELMILVVVVVVRTLISFFLEKDFREALHSAKLLKDGELNDFYIPSVSRRMSRVNTETTETTTENK
ncbi:DUF1622 domain-containing protein [Mycoplasma sp. P36-A1]|uniref:DUF1622 domain-containing protein n=1 Tax=Mycoplasma sp. P36-A1 TaxID=3252900 RepID=UPI003C2D4B71